MRLSGAYPCPLGRPTIQIVLGEAILLVMPKKLPGSRVGSHHRFHRFYVCTFLFTIGLRYNETRQRDEQFFSKTLPNTLVFDTMLHTHRVLNE